MSEATQQARATEKPWVIDLLVHLFLVFAIGVGVSIVLAGAVLALSAEARAQNAEESPPAADERPRIVPMTPSEAQSGTLLFRSRAKGDTFAAPLLKTDVVIRVTGMVARAEVTQTFRNPFDDWYEGVYVFPLPENAAVDHLRMQIGARTVEGEIRERGLARKDYEHAKATGRRAALLEQERPNIFTSSVANIGPRDKITVRIEYQQTLKPDAGRWSLRFPMVVGPRYIPGTIPTAGEPGTGWAANTTRVSDAARITPPVLPPRADEPPINPVSIHVELDAGVPLAEIDSPYHKFAVQTIDHRRQIIDLADGATPATRDFELVWKPVVESAPRAAWFTEAHGAKSYGLLMLMPPNTGTQARIPREAIFVIDTSGSMYGTSIAQAKQALELAIERLAPEDRFNVIEFNSYARSLFDTARPASRDNRAEARGWVRGLKAQGGTEIAKALDLALNGRETPDRVRQVIFLTDGQVGNEDELFRLIQSRLGDSRLFTVGIGSAPNSHFMTGAAKYGRGTFTYIGKIEEVGEKMTALFAKLESPVLKGVRIDWPEGAAAEMWPARIPDLYAGEPVVVTVALGSLQGTARVSGYRGNAPWETSIRLDQPAQGSGLGVLWARDKIAALMDVRRDPSGAPEDATRAQVIEVALAHHLVTKYTSLVAIDSTPARPAGLDLKTAAMPTNLPEGQDYAHIFGGAPVGELPKGATGSRLQMLIGAALMLIALVLFLLERALRSGADEFRRVALLPERRLAATLRHAY